MKNKLRNKIKDQTQTSPEFSCESLTFLLLYDGSFVPAASGLQAAINVTGRTVY